MNSQQKREPIHGNLINQILSHLSRYQFDDDQFIDALTENEQNLSYAMNAFSSQLLELNRQEEAKWLWSTVLRICRDKSAHILHSYSLYLSRSSESGFTNALEQLERCTFLFPKFALSFESLENMKSLIVDRWHFRMLNDDVRNMSYKACIELLLQSRSKGAVVLDIGGGTGILSIFASFAGASHVYMCETSKDLCLVAERAISSLDLSDNITVIGKHSLDLKVGLNCDLNGTVDIIITELVDSGLLGEHIVATLRDAKKLLSKDGVIVPSHATLYGYPIQSGWMAVRQRVCLSSRSLASMDSSPRISHDLAEEFNGILLTKSTCFQNLRIDEKYSCENLLEIPHTKLSEPVKLGDIYFSEFSEALLSSISVIATESGFVDAFAYWFDLVLHEGIPPISTAPGRVRCSWDQAILFNRLPLKSLSKGTTIRCDTSCSDDGVKIIIRYEDSSDENNYTKSFTEEDVLFCELDCCDTSRHILVGEKDFAIINDRNRLNSFLLGLSLAISSGAGKSFLIELCPPWLSVSLAALTLKLHWNCEISNTRNCICCRELIGATKVCPSCHNYIVKAFDGVSRILLSAPSDEVKAFFDELIQGVSDLEGVSITAIIGPFLRSLEDTESSWLNFSSDIDSVVIMCDLIEANGLFRQGCLLELKFLLSLVDFHSSRLQKSLTVVTVPSSVSVVVALLESHVLVEHHVVHPSRLQGAVGCSALNRFGASVLQDVDLAHLTGLRYLSDPIVATTFMLKDLANANNAGLFHTCNTTVGVSSNGSVNGIGVWYILNMKPEPYCDSTGLGRWADDLSVNTGPEEVRKRCLFPDDLNFSHYRQAVFLVKEPHDVFQNSFVTLRLDLDISSVLQCEMSCNSL